VCCVCVHSEWGDTHLPPGTNIFSLAQAEDSSNFTNPAVSSLWHRYTRHGVCAGREAEVSVGQGLGGRLHLVEGSVVDCSDPARALSRTCRIDCGKEGVPPLLNLLLISRKSLSLRQPCAVSIRPPRPTPSQHVRMPPDTILSQPHASRLVCVEASKTRIRDHLRTVQRSQRQGGTESVWNQCTR
jgi:hypothetical protein